MVAQESASQTRLNALIEQTRVSAQERLNTAQELSLIRHSLNDELSELSRELLSFNREQGAAPSLLEDLETLHRNLKELESVKDYVQVIRHVLELR